MRLHLQEAEEFLQTYLKKNQAGKIGSSEVQRTK
jgi:hypothetical protein